jgi:2-hydroxychromene-2-carboxylate isomerase
MRWMARNNLRKAKLLGLTLRPPAFHPFNPLLALRVSSLPLDAAARDAVIGALFDAVWVRSLHVSEPAVVERLGDEIGLAGATLVAEAQRPESKARLRRQTDDAIARGVFGVPSMEVGEELFWGYDDFPYLELFLAGKDPLDAAAWKEWFRPPRRSAMRRRFRPQDENA